MKRIFLMLCLLTSLMLAQSIETITHSNVNEINNTARLNMSLGTNSTFTMTVSEVFQSRRAIRLIWTGTISIYNPLTNKYGYLENVGKTVTLNISDSSLAYITPSEITVNGQNITIKYTQTNNYANLNQSDIYILAKHEGSGLIYDCTGYLAELFLAYKNCTNIATNTTNIATNTANIANLQKRNNLLIFTNGSFAPTIVESPLTNRISISWTGYLYIQNPINNKYTRLSSPIILDDNDSSTCYIKLSEIDTNNNYATNYYFVWNSTSLGNSDYLPLINHNYGGTLEKCAGILGDFIKGVVHRTKIDINTTNIATNTAKFTALFGNSSDKLSFMAGVIRLYGHIPFCAGSSAITAGTTIKDKATGDSAVVQLVRLQSGSWTGGDGKGYIAITPYSGVASEFIGKFADGDTLIVGLTKKALVNGSIYGGWEQINGNHQSINIDSLVTTSTYCRIYHNHSFSKVNAFTATHDESGNDWQMGMSVGLDFSDLHVRRLTANTSTGAITGMDIDYSDLANCTTSANIWLLGIFKTP